MELVALAALCRIQRLVGHPIQGVVAVGLLDHDRTDADDERLAVDDDGMGLPAMRSQMAAMFSSVWTDFRYATNSSPPMRAIRLSSTARWGLTFRVMMLCRSEAEIC